MTIRNQRPCHSGQKGRKNRRPAPAARLRAKNKTWSSGPSPLCRFHHHGARSGHRRASDNPQASDAVGHPSGAATVICSPTDTWGTPHGVGGAPPLALPVTISCHDDPHMPKGDAISQGRKRVSATKEGRYKASCSPSMTSRYRFFFDFVFTDFPQTKKPRTVLNLLL
jgi:hypothetical protein